MKVEESEVEEEEEEVVSNDDNDDDDYSYNQRSRSKSSKSNNKAKSRSKSSKSSSKQSEKTAKSLNKSNKKDNLRVNKKEYDPVPDQKYPDNLTPEQKILKLRRELPPLQPGEEVLARWPDDGWYYRSVIKEHLGNFRYRIEDGLRDEEEMERENIISEYHDSHDSLESGDPVVALHPEYAFSYAPGQIVKVADDLTKVVVRFYDFVEAVVFREDVYKLNRLKFERDVNAIIELEKRWVGQTVVARNNYSNVYELGKVISRVGHGRQYTIEWANGRQSIQKANHIFGEFTRNPHINVNDYVLAPKETIYLPGRIIGKRGEHFRVKFVDGDL